MNDLFDPKTMNLYIGRINSLSKTSQRQWGKMEVAQMLHHCQKAFEMVDERLKPKTNPIFKFLFGRSAKKEMLNREDFRRELPTFKELRVSEQLNLEEEKRILVEAIQQFHKRGEDGITAKQHGLFGQMSTSEWSLLITKHLDHHLKQFGA